MAEYLLMSGNKAACAVYTLAVAADIAARCGQEAQVDIAVGEACADYCTLGQVVRRVVPIDHSRLLPERVRTSWWQSVRAFGQAAGETAKRYMQLAAELRLTQYDAVFDLEGSPPTLALSRFLKADKIVGFEGNRALAYHESYRIDETMPYGRRARCLVGRHLDYDMFVSDWQLKVLPLPAWLRPTSYVFLTEPISPEQLAVLTDSGVAVVGEGMMHAPPEGRAILPEEGLALVRSAIAVVGSGAAVVLSAALGRHTFFTGEAQDKPEGAIQIETPAQLSDALRCLMQPAKEQTVPATRLKTAASLTVAAPVIYRLPMAIVAAAELSLGETLCRDVAQYSVA